MDIDTAWKRLSEMGDIKNAAISKFVDRVLTVSSSALAFSITFRGSLVGVGAQDVWLLKVAWVSLGLCSIVGVLLHLSQASAANRMIKKMKGDLNERYAAANPVFGFGFALLILAFPVGIASLMMFGLLNTN
ncbi:MAG: hypothetical protein AAF558_07905 [Verrucomicrobiota bacterium]